MVKKTVIVVIALGIASLLAHLYVESQVYYPVVTLQLPEGVSVAAVFAETKERKACGAANDRFLAPIKAQCKECKVVSARCERELDGLNQALRDGVSLPYPIVVGTGVRVAFM